MCTKLVFLLILGAAVIPSLARANDSVTGPGPLPPPPARLIAPRSGEVINGPLSEKEFVWSIVEPAVKYHIEVSPDREFYRLTREVYTETNRHAFDKLPPGTYFWRVSSINAIGMEGGASQVCYFVYPEPMGNK